MVAVKKRNESKGKELKIIRQFLLEVLKCEKRRRKGIDWTFIVQSASK
jgi:hypothetical protein